MGDAPLQVGFSGQFDVRFLKAGEHTLVIPIPDNIVTLIGHIAVQWGGFELRMDGMIQGLHAGLRKREPENWRRQNFKKRKAMFKALAAEYTAHSAPSEATTLRDIATRSGDLHWRRNLIVHGYIQVLSRPKPPPETGRQATYIVATERKGKYVEIVLDEDTLVKLRHDIAHLGGNLMAAMARMGGHLTTNSPELVIADSDLLQEATEGNFQTVPIPSKRLLPTQPAGGQ